MDHGADLSGDARQAGGRWRDRPNARIELFFDLWNLLVFATWLVVPFVLAGTARWWPGWLHLAAYLGVQLEGSYVSRKNPELKRRRRHIGEGTKRWDLFWNAAFWPLMASMALTAGVEYARHGSPLPPWLWPLGLAVFGSGIALSAWAMGTNPYFEGTVRIQKEVGHRVCDKGPYRHIRHPGYAGLILMALGTPLLLLSVRAFLPAAAVAAWVVLRTALEDATLRRELEGYPEYAARTRSRLVPRVW